MKYLFLTLILSVFISCNSTDNDNEVVDYRLENEEQITSYIEKNNLDAIKTESGLYYVINEPGTGAKPTETSNVTVAYKGYYTNETVFDQSTASGISFNLQQVIKGWTEGITYFNEGGSGLLLVPSHLGYGSNDHRSIPGGSVLIFEINLISVN